MTQLIHEEETYAIIGAAMEVYNHLGNGFLEAVYQEALSIEFELRGILFHAQKPLTIHYKDRLLAQKYIPDFVACDAIVVEIKSIDDAVGERPTVPMAMSLNRYMYVGGNVANLVDPSGMFGESPAIWATCIEEPPTPVGCGAVPPNPLIRTEDEHELMLLAVNAKYESHDWRSWYIQTYIWLNRLDSWRFRLNNPNLSIGPVLASGSVGWEDELKARFPHSLEDMSNPSADFVKKKLWSSGFRENPEEACPTVRWVVGIWGTDALYNELYYFDHWGLFGHWEEGKQRLGRQRCCDILTWYRGAEEFTFVGYVGPSYITLAGDLKLEHGITKKDEERKARGEDLDPRGYGRRSDAPKDCDDPARFPEVARPCLGTYWRFSGELPLPLPDDFWNTHGVLL